MITFKEFLINEGKVENKVVVDYLTSFSPLEVLKVKSSGNSIIINIKGDIDSSMSYVNKALDLIGYEIDNADNKEDSVEYIGIPLK
jgi:hypothetical protein